MVKGVNGVMLRQKHIFPFRFAMEMQVILKMKKKWSWMFQAMKPRYLIVITKLNIYMVIIFSCRLYMIHRYRV